MPRICQDETSPAPVMVAQPLPAASSQYSHVLRNEAAPEYEPTLPVSDSPIHGMPCTFGADVAVTWRGRISELGALRSLRTMPKPGSKTSSCAFILWPASSSPSA